jgi:tetratricopeptide (TPR) repeat protein
VSDFKAESLWKSGVCLGSAFFGGVLGNLAANVVWEVGKFALQPLLEKVPSLGELLSNGGAEKNHDLLRALRRSECSALVAVIDQTLLDDYGLRSGKGPLVERLKARWKERREPELALLCQLRRHFQAEASQVMRMPLADLAQIKVKGTNLLDVADVVSTGTEIMRAESADELRERSVGIYLKALEQSIRPRSLPLGFKERFVDVDKGWFPLLRVSFHEELKTNEKARIAFELDCLSILPQVFGKSFQELDSRLNTHGVILGTTLRELRDFREQLDGALIAVSETVDSVLAIVQDNLVVSQESLGLIKEIHRVIAVPISRITNEPDDTPSEFQILFDEAKSLAEAGKHREAEVKYKEILHRAATTKHRLIGIRATVGIASQKRTYDIDAARALFRECLENLKGTPSDRIREDVLCKFGDMEALSGNLLEGRGLLMEALSIAHKLGERQRIAENTTALALVADGDGRLDEAVKLYDEAAEIFMTEYQQHNMATQKNAAQGLGICFNNKSVTQRHQLDLVGSLSSLSKALEWFRKSDSQSDLPRVLFLLAEAKYAAAKWDEGKNHVNEALKIATQREDYVWIRRCLDLRARVKFTSGDRKGALQDFSAALSIVRKNGTPEEVVHNLEKVATVSAKCGLKEEARKLLQEALVLSQKHDLLEDYADAVLDLAGLEDGPDVENQRDKALSIAIASLERALVRKQVKAQRAFVMGRIGSLYQRMRGWNDALNWLTQAKQVFEEIGDVSGIANCLGSIAEIKRATNLPHEELEAYRQILSLVEGKPLPELVATTKNNMAHRLMEQGFLREAQQHLIEASNVCLSHKLSDLHRHVLRNLDRVEHYIEAQKPPAMSFSDLVHELHELVRFFPEAKDSILRFWYYSRDAELHSNCRSVLGVKLLIAENDTQKFLALVSKLSAYSDLNLQVVSTEYPGFGIDFVPFPHDKVLPNKIALPRVTTHGDINYVRFERGSMDSPYALTGDSATSKATGNTAVVLFGHARGLPPEANKLMLDLSEKEILSRKVLFFPVERANAHSRLLNDLRIAKDQRLIPVYYQRLPVSEEVDALASIKLLFPVISSLGDGGTQRGVGRVKRKLIQILSLSSEDPVSALTDIAGELEDLCATAQARETIDMTGHFLRFSDHGHARFHFALVHH